LAIRANCFRTIWSNMSLMKRKKLFKLFYNYRQW
jgi:hypothetical protein